MSAKDENRLTCHFPPAPLRGSSIIQYLILESSTIWKLLSLNCVKNKMFELRNYSGKLLYQPLNYLTQLLKGLCSSRPWVNPSLIKPLLDSKKTLEPSTGAREIRSLNIHFAFNKRKSNLFNWTASSLTVMQLQRSGSLGQRARLASSKFLSPYHLFSRNLDFHISLSFLVGALLPCSHQIRSFDTFV
jgi:hypothetical protein